KLPSLPESKRLTTDQKTLQAQLSVSYRAPAQTSTFDIFGDWQDISQPNSEANPPDGVLAVPLLRHQFGQVGVGNNDDHSSPGQVSFPEDQKISQVACGWRHTLALSEKKNVFSGGRGTSGQLGNGEIVDRNTPVLIDALSSDGSACKKLESSTAAPFSGLMIFSAKRYQSFDSEIGALIEDGKGDFEMLKKKVLECSALFHPAS
ncbi:hypothetical protein ACJX0J_041801, partial [Zea mays]